jgi:hypothetical protein
VDPVPFQHHIRIAISGTECNRGWVGIDSVFYQRSRKSHDAAFRIDLRPSGLKRCEGGVRVDGHTGPFQHLERRTGNLSDISVAEWIVERSGRTERFPGELPRQCLLLDLTL